jgi:hypothetical protein
VSRTEGRTTKQHADEHAPLVVVASTDADYERYRVARERVEPFEDGARTDGRPGTYEWWYFDAQLEDGAKLVVVFMDKDLASPRKPLAPLIRLNLDLADGRRFEKLARFDPEAWSAATDGADVRIARNSFRGDLHHYHITASIDEIAVEVDLVGQIPSWRPGTGYMLFGPTRDLERCRLSRPQLGQRRADGDHQRLVLGPRPSGPVLGDRLSRHRT